MASRSASEHDWAFPRRFYRRGGSAILLLKLCSGARPPPWLAVTLCEGGGCNRQSGQGLAVESLDRLRLRDRESLFAALRTTSVSANLKRERQGTGSSSD